MATPAPFQNPSPKQRFQESADNITKHRDLVDSKEFQRSCDFAILQYEATLSSQTIDGTGAAANHFKMRGVMEFLQVFRLLAEKAPQIKVLDKDNLNPTN